jgi:RHS repeat-associated protein
MPPHVPKPFLRLFPGKGRQALALSLSALGFFTFFASAASPRPVADGSSHAVGETAKRGEARWLGALTAAPGEKGAASLDGPASPSSVAPSFRVVDAGTLGGSSFGFAGDAWDINGSGTIVGQAVKPGGARRPFVYHLGDSSMAELTSVPGFLSGAWGINDGGKIVGGYDSGSTRHAYLYVNGSVTDIGNLSGDLTHDWATARKVNGGGAIAGDDSSGVDTQIGLARAFYYDGAMYDTGRLPSTIECTGYDLNDSGFEVGSCDDYSGTTQRAFRYERATTELIDLGVLNPGDNADAQAINAGGAITGNSGVSVGNSGSHAVVWSGGSIYDLGSAFVAQGINDGGAVVGRTPGNGLTHGYIYTGGTAYDLNDLVPAGSGYTILEAHAINNSGHIAARALAPDGLEHAVVLLASASVPIGQTYGDNWGRNPTHSWAEPVNSASGAYLTSATDLSLAGLGVPFKLTRSYVSANTDVGILGKGWSTTLTSALAIDPVSGDVLLKGDDGQQVAYTLQGDGSFAGAPGAEATLASIPGGYELIRKDQTHLRFDTSGVLTSIKDRNGEGLTLAYTAGQLTSVTDSAGREVDLAYTNGLLSSATLPDGRSVQYGYTNGLLTTVIDARGGTTSYEYDSGDRLSRIVDQNQHTVVENVYGSDGRVTDQYDARGGHSTFGWDPETQTATFTDARGKVWTDVYQSNVLQTSADPLGHTTTYEFDIGINLGTVTDARGKKTTSTYDSRGNVLTRKAPAPLSYLETWTYDAFNNVETYTDGRGNTTTYGYDGAGNLTSTTGADPDGAGPLTPPVTTITRDPAGTGLITAIQDARLKSTQYGYDTEGNLTSIQTPLGNETTMHYDGSGRRDYLVEPRGNVDGADPNQFKWQYVYNGFDDLVTVTDPLGHATTLSYDPAGLVQSKTDANQHTTSYTYWESNQLKTVTAPDPDGAGPALTPVTQYTYDGTGHLATRTDANQNVTLYGYDDAGELTSVQTPLGKLWTYGYDANGNLEQIIDANGNATQTAGDGTTTYGYDELNRLTSISYSDSTPAVSFTYDEDGNRKTMVDGGGTANYTYDNLNRLTSVARGSNTFSYAYDPTGNVTQRTYPDSTVINYGYDDDGRLQSVANTGVGTTSYDYDAAANPIATTLPSGNGYVESRTYDNAGRLTEVKNVKGASVLADYVQTLDDVGNPLATTVSGASPSTTTYGYDNLARLTSVCFQASCPNSTDPKIAWTYDGLGNRLTETRATSSTSYGFDIDDRLTQTTVTPGTNPYPAQAQTDGAQPYWRLGEVTGTTFASSVGTYNGTWSGSPTLGITGVLNNDPNGAVTLNGTSQYGTVANATQMSKSNNFSLEIWVKRTKNASSQAVVGKPLSTSTKTENYAFWFDTANKIRFEVGGGGNKFATVTSAAALDTNWHHVVGTFASGSLKLYVDGVQSATVTANFTTAATNTSALNVGRAGTANYYGGSLDEVALYGTALTAAQAADHRAKAVNTPPPTTTTNAYDDDGRLTNSGSDSFGWNLANRLTTATVGGQTVAYGYDGDGNRLTAMSGAVTTKSVWDTNNSLPQLAIERDGANALLRRYIAGTDTVSMTTPAGNFFFHHDPLGSVSNLTNTGGATQWTLGYDAFGGPRSTIKNDASAPPLFLRFAGQYLDGATNLYNLRARQYDAAAGRFLSRDPIDAAGSAQVSTDPEPGTPVGDPTMPIEFHQMSSYAYARDNPLLFTDPSGESVRGAFRLVVGTVKEMPGTVRTAVSSPENFEAFVGSAASYSIGVGIVWRLAPLAYRGCMRAPTTLLDPLGKIDHAVLSCRMVRNFVRGTSGAFFLGGGLMSRHLADEELGRSSK